MNSGYSSQAIGRFDRDRVFAGMAVAVLHVAIGYLLVVGLAPDLVVRGADALAVFDVTLPKSPPPAETPKPKKAHDVRKTGAAAPANREARPSEIVAPPVPPPPMPPPILAAPVAGPDVQAASGAAPLPGPGTDGGGQGEGTGSGSEGTGSGSEGNGQGAGGRGSFARKISGQIEDRDYPKAAARAGIGGTVWVRYTVTPKGRAEDCRVTRSSGNTDIDAVTCKLILKRFRYRPGTDAAGRSVASVVEEDHHWLIERDGRADDWDDR